MTGSNIPTAGSAAAYDTARNTLERGLLEARRRQVMATTTAPTPTPVAAPATSNTTIPPLLARRPQPAPARQGMIDGKPAREALAGMQQQALEGGPAQTYGADVATRNIASMGVNDAVADYFQRNRLDAERPQRAADARAAAAEPGSMFERSRPEMAGPPATGVVGPAQRAMLDARASRAERLVQGPPTSAMTVRQAGPPSLLQQSGPPVSAMPVEQDGPPILARPRQEAQPPALVQRTNAFAQSLRDRAATPYQQRMVEGAVTLDDVTKTAGGVAKTVAAIPAKARAFSDRTNQMAENFRRKYAP